MFDELRSLSQHFLEIKSSPYRRYLIRTAKFNSRLSFIIGQRGVGKTTTLIQALLDFVSNDRFNQKILYIQADHFILGTTSLYEIAEQFQLLGGKWLAIDEIHKYPDWSIELKSIYDTFPKLQVLASGSSALKLHQGTHDLSRRAIVYRMHGMSFREYLELFLSLELTAYSLKEICSNHQKISSSIVEKLGAKNTKIIPEFHKYLKTGYYPFSLEIDDQADYLMTLEQGVHTTLESDLASIYPQLTGSSINKIKKLLIYIANSVPFAPNWNSIQSALDIGDIRTLKTYFSHLESAGLIHAIPKATKKFSQLETPSKIYLENTNQLFALSSDTPEKGTLRETFFLNSVSKNYQVAVPADGDFLIDNTFLFEVGGKKKTFEQIKDVKESYLACDDIEHGIGDKIPLWIFGFLY